MNFLPKGFKEWLQLNNSSLSDTSLEAISCEEKTEDQFLTKDCWDQSWLKRLMLVPLCKALNLRAPDGHTLNLTISADMPACNTVTTQMQCYRAPVGHLHPNLLGPKQHGFNMYVLIHYNLHLWSSRCKKQTLTHRGNTFLLNK